LTLINLDLFSLESEACYYFDMQYAKQLWQEGRWEELLEYIEPFLNQANPVDEKKVKYLRWIIHRQRYWELVEAYIFTQHTSLRELKKHFKCSSIKLTISLKYQTQVD
jgi:hypothetical protein